METFVPEHELKFVLNFFPDMGNFCSGVRVFDVESIWIQGQ